MKFKYYMERYDPENDSTPSVRGLDIELIREIQYLDDKNTTLFTLLQNALSRISTLEEIIMRLTQED